MTKNKPGDLEKKRIMLKLRMAEELLRDYNPYKSDRQDVLRELVDVLKSAKDIAEDLIENDPLEKRNSGSDGAGV